VIDNEPKILTGHGSWRITLQGGGIVMFECWDYDDEGKAVAYYSAGKAPE
jgi:hypothetical protein